MSIVPGVWTAGGYIPSGNTSEAMSNVGHNLTPSLVVNLLPPTTV
jgi:hypothetical protein